MVERVSGAREGDKADMGWVRKGKVGKNHMTVGLMRHVKDFRPYPKGSGKLLKGLKEG